MKETRQENKKRRKEKNANFDIAEFNRRELIKAGLAGLIPLLFGGCAALGNKKTAIKSPAIKVGKAGYEFDANGWIEPPNGCVPSACWQCVCRCSAWFFKNSDGVFTHVEGNPNSLRTRGKVCVRSHGAVSQVYNPDRILFPMLHIGQERGDGQWKRISWDEALKIVAERMKKNIEAGTPEKIMPHYGRAKASFSQIIFKLFFQKVVGTGTIGNHTSICEGGKWTSQELVWGKHYDINDVEKTNFVLNFGCNVFEAHTSHNVFSQRVTEALAKGVPMHTFDVRLSNTAAKSTQWIPIKPGTDLAVILAMAHVVIQEGLYDSVFIDKWTNVTIPELEKHLSGYTPEWAEKISSVPAATIKKLAKKYAKAKPGTTISYRGAIAHYNGVDTERAIMMLEALCGNIDVFGGRCKAVGAQWINSFKVPEYVKEEKKLKILDGEGIAYPTHHVSNQVLRMIKEGKQGRPDMYITYCHNPVYANGDCGGDIEIFKNKDLIPFFVSVDAYYSESTALADLILPDAVYPEKWTWEDMVSYDQIAEYYIRQPVVKPLAEARDFSDVCCELARMLGRPLPFNSHEEFVKDACENTPGVKEAGGFDFMKKYGVWYDKTAKPAYKSHEKELKPEDLAGTSVDIKTGVIWKGKVGEGYAATKDAYKLYVGQMIDDVAYKGFPPDKINKSGKFEIYSQFLVDKGWYPLPTWIPVPEHKRLKKDELILTTFKVMQHVQSRTQNCKYLTEIYHDNPAWLNSETAKQFGISDGDSVKIVSKIGGVITKVKVTEGIVPGVIAISHHCGHWQYGRYASGVKSPFGRDDEQDLQRIWWKKNRGMHLNWIIPNSPDPISGQQRGNDTVVTIERIIE